MRRSLVTSPRTVSQIRSLASLRPTRSAKPPFLTVHVSKQRAKLHQDETARNLLIGRCLSTTSRRLRPLAAGTGPATEKNEGIDQGSTVETEALPSRRSQTSRRELKNAVRTAVKAKTDLLAQPGIPSETAVIAALNECLAAARLLAGGGSDEAQPSISSSTASGDASAEILALDDTNAPKTVVAGSTPRSSSSKQRSIASGLSETAFAIVAHQPVKLTPAILELYVKIQSLLGTPQTLPEVFRLYAQKDIPRISSSRWGGSGSSEITYSKQNPNKTSLAIPSNIAELALDAAIAARDMGAAVGVIEHSYMTRAFVRSKLIQRATLPFILAVGGAPPAAWLLAGKWSLTQDAMDPWRAQMLVAAAILAYFGFTGSLGVIALLTHNDQMRRISWQPGMPLRERWLREEERAALDRVACAWGFREPERHGEEQGPEWEALRDYVGLKGMILDKTELMEGMS